MLSWIKITIKGIDKRSTTWTGYGQRSVPAGQLPALSSLFLGLFFSFREAWKVSLVHRLSNNLWTQFREETPFSIYCWSSSFPWSQDSVLIWMTIDRKIFQLTVISKQCWVWEWIINVSALYMGLSSEVFASYCTVWKSFAYILNVAVPMKGLQ